LAGPYAKRVKGTAATTESAILAKVDYALNLNNNPEGAAERVYTMLEFLGLDQRADVKAALACMTC
jgi:hypothetical protein